ncbi:MarR family transcriptional regulator [Lentilactobacillus sp. Marseille-Q4993]|uniref:MarR family winged helix-turn-helix transcriptional regulator n=1 Tax=Lentilactobacillus sp. Marseille-Q4993 TaxID=3039492 RepID=UPI0024BC3A3A|nr:MarR family transcriptional regulator [Lentilactobacillus sp. Marseille-Q4993]
MISNDVLKRLIESFIKVNNQMDHIQKVPINILGDVQISTRALHLLVTIGNYDNSNVTMIADRLGITKGAVSQQIKNLRRENLIKINYADGNKKEKLLSLTSKGMQVFDAHESLHQDLYAEINNNLAKLSGEQQKLILDTLNDVSGSIAKYQDQLAADHDSAEKK